MNFRKAKVSKAAWLLAPTLGLLGPAPAPAPLALPYAAPDPAQMAYAEPPPLPELPLGALADEVSQAQAAGTCATDHRELRFEMLSESEPHPPPRRNAVVCLAVYRPR